MKPSEHLFSQGVRLPHRRHGPLRSTFLVETLDAARIYLQQLILFERRVEHRPQDAIHLDGLDLRAAFLEQRRAPRPNSGRLDLPKREMRKVLLDIEALDTLISLKGSRR